MQEKAVIGHDFIFEFRTIIQPNRSIGTAGIGLQIFQGELIAKTDHQSFCHEEVASGQKGMKLNQCWGATLTRCSRNRIVSSASFCSFKDSFPSQTSWTKIW